MESIFEALAANGSYAWQSMLKSRKVISMGMRWRIGDGKSIEGAKVVSPYVPAFEGAKVAALINPNIRTWNIDLLHQHFLSFEANRIKQYHCAGQIRKTASFGQIVIMGSIW